VNAVRQPPWPVDRVFFRPEPEDHPHAGVAWRAPCALANITSVRAVTEGRPLSVLVGMLIAAFQTKQHVCTGTAGVETNSIWFKQ
jgi:hypothetical protein